MAVSQDVHVLFFYIGNTLAVILRRTFDYSEFKTVLTKFYPNGK
jgi:hypothetical protein